ncbi:MAG: hypothetical protein QG656_2322 [Candidatus Hydrogenedentes bacterium]|nr:hypothetical protein [Candidatus Hydrogenedentota bacterium]
MTDSWSPLHHFINSLMPSVFLAACILYVIFASIGFYKKSIRKQRWFLVGTSFYVVGFLLHLLPTQEMSVFTEAGFHSIMHAVFFFFVFRWWYGKRTLGRSVFFVGHLLALCSSLNPVFIDMAETSATALRYNQWTLLTTFLGISGLAGFLIHLTGFILVVCEEMHKGEGSKWETFGGGQISSKAEVRREETKE